MEVRVDVDSTLCRYDEQMVAYPRREVIARVNALYDAGHRITIWSSRNLVADEPQEEFTRGQLDAWGVKYHAMDLNKPLYHLYIDDRSINVEHWLQGMEVPCRS